MAHRTAWVKAQNSSLPSDRLKPSPPPTRPASVAKSKSKGKEAQALKSTEVVALETLINGLRTASAQEKDPHGGCFCQARSHDLSLYTPICLRCGIILCDLNPPQCVCPHCSSPLLSDRSRTALIDKIESQITQVIAKEVEAAERAIEEARQAAGAFPTLGVSAKCTATTVSSVPPHMNVQTSVANNQSHKVLSLNSKTKKVTVASYGATPPRSPAPSRPASRAEKEEAAVIRVRPPSPIAGHINGKVQLDPTRPWADLSGKGPIYIAPPRVDGDSREGASKSARKRARQKQREKTETAGRP